MVPDPDSRRFAIADSVLDFAYAVGRTDARPADAINPEGIDPSYFYGASFMDQGKMKSAKLHLQRALEIPMRPIANQRRREKGRTLRTRLERR